MEREWRGRQGVIVYNGEAFNHRELRRELEAQGVRFTTQCDTEVVLFAYLVLGEACVERLDGQFAFAIWDEKDHALFLARDIAGIKPLFYTTTGETFIFASEPKALFVYPGVRKAPNREALAEYLLHGYAFASGYVAGERTFYEGITALPPGHTLTVRDGAVERRQYWQPPEVVEGRSAEEWAERVRGVLEGRMMDYVSEEVPVGVALSGGVDSSIITALAAREMNSVGKQIVASTIYYEGQPVNPDYESAAALVSFLRGQGVELEFTRSVLTTEDYLSELDRLLCHFDEPHWEVKQLAMFRNYRRLKESGAKVVLTGEGADELFYGYYVKFPGFKNPRLASSAELKALWRRRLPHVGALFSEGIRRETDDLLPWLMNQAVGSIYDSDDIATSDPDKRMQYWYFRTFLPWLLTVNDRCSMAFSLEGRFPFLDKELIEIAFQMPARLNTTGSGKTVLRDAFRHLLPETVREREKAPLPSPMGLAFHEVIQRAFEHELAESRHSEVWGILSLPALEEMNRRFKERIAEVRRNPPRPDEDSVLVRYMSLNQELELKTVHVFSLLTIIRWFRLNFEQAEAYG